MNGLYKSPLKSFFIFIIISIIFLVSALKLEIGQQQNSKYKIYTIEFDYFGMDANKLEELITNPLEERLMCLSGIIELKSSIDYSKSVTSIYFAKRENSKKNYLLIRNIVETLYTELPADVQKPRIYESDSTAKGIFCAAFAEQTGKLELRDWIEQNLKKKLESIDGVSEVVVAGGIQREVLVNFDPDKAASAMQNPDNFSTIIQDGNFGNYFAYINTGNKKNYIKFDTKIHDLTEMRELPVNLDNSMTQLGHIADINFSKKEDDEIVTLDGKKCVSIIVKSSSDGNAFKISNECRKIFNKIDTGSLEYKVLYDVGAEQKEMISAVLKALCQSFCFLLLIIPLFFNSKRAILLIFILLPVSILWTIGIIQFFHIAINENIIAGITIALGLIVDPLLVIAEIAEQSLSRKDFISKTKNISHILITATFTTLIAFIPLFLLDNIVPGVKNIAFSITVMITVSLFIELLFVPCFIYSNNKNRPNIFFNKFYRFQNKFIYILCFFSIKHNKILKVLYGIFIVLPFLFIIISGKSLSFEQENKIIYCSIDYEPEISAEYINKELIPFIEKVKSNENVLFVRSEIHKGSVDIDVGYKNGKDRLEIAKFINSLSSYIPNGFLYVPGIENKTNTKHSLIEIAFSGDDSSRCKEIAKNAARTLSNNPAYSSVVLNFKNDEFGYIFYPDLIKMRNNDLSVYSLASTLRWFMFGPVSDKWIEDGKEYDIRISGKNLSNTTIKNIEGIMIPVKNGAVPLSTLGEIHLVSASGKIYHKNSRRTAYISVEIDNMSTESAVKLIKNDLMNFPMDRGYTFSFSYELSKVKENYRLLIGAMFFSILQVLLAIIFLTENIKRSFIIISTIPVSIMIPLFIKIILRSPIQVGDIIGIIILSGITVNNIVYIMESTYNSVLYKIRNKARSILVSSITTICSSVPLLFMASEGFSRLIAFFMIFGMINSVLCSFIFIPGLLTKEYKKQNNHHSKN